MGISKGSSCEISEMFEKEDEDKHAKEHDDTIEKQDAQG